MTTWILNSAVLASGAYGMYRYEPATWNDVAMALRGPHESRIGYPETAALIGRKTGTIPVISRDVSVMQPNDVAFVVRLAYRVDPTAKGKPTASSDSDWEVARLVRFS